MEDAIKNGKENPAADKAVSDKTIFTKHYSCNDE
jgi:hypothetical protein